MKTRIISAAVGLILLSVVLYLFNTAVLDVAVCALSVVAVHEFINAVGLSKKKIFEIICLAFGALFSSRFLPITSGITVITELFFAGIMLLAVLFDHNEIKATDMAFAFFVTVLVPRAFSTLLLFRNYGSPISYFLVFLSFAVAWLNDTFAYFTGYFFGKHKLCPEISPKKTIEGAIGGVVGNIVFCVVGAYIFSMNTDCEISWISFILFLPVGTVSGIFGDLCASIIKRQFGIKDYGNIMPGHGGVMDRFDSWLFVAPIIYIWNIYYPFIQ